MSKFKGKKISLTIPREVMLKLAGADNLDSDPAMIRKLQRYKREMKFKSIVGERRPIMSRSTKNFIVTATDQNPNFLVLLMQRAGE